MRFIDLAVCSLTLAACVLWVGVAVGADEAQIEPSQLPKPVAEAVAARFPGAQVVAASKETSEKQVVYDIELQQQGHKYEMDIKSDGTVLEIESQIEVKRLPDAVSAAVKTKFPGVTIDEVMEVALVGDKRETLDHYEVAITKPDKKTSELIASLDGKSVEEEK